MRSNSETECLQNKSKKGKYQLYKSQWLASKYQVVSHETDSEPRWEGRKFNGHHQVAQLSSLPCVTFFWQGSQNFTHLLMSAKTKCCQHGISASWESNLKIFRRKNYAKWVDHVIETCDMWCAMFELCLYSIPGKHLTHRVDPEWSHAPGWKEIESGASWKKFLISWSDNYIRAHVWTGERCYQWFAPNCHQSDIPIAHTPYEIIGCGGRKCCWWYFANLPFMWSM